jgi:hypothetical protein
MIPRIIGMRSALVDEDQAFRLQIKLAFEPVVPLLQDIGAVLLDSMASLYGMARPFSPASYMVPVLEEGKERTDVYCDPWC